MLAKIVAPKLFAPRPPVESSKTKSINYGRPLFKKIIEKRGNNFASFFYLFRLILRGAGGKKGQQYWPTSVKNVRIKIFVGASERFHVILMTRGW